MAVRAPIPCAFMVPKRDREIVEATQAKRMRTGMSGEPGGWNGRPVRPALRFPRTRRALVDLPTRPMKTLLLKEARMLLPVWLAALLLAVVPMWLMSIQPLWSVITLFCLGVGVVLVSVAPFGMEFSNGTFQFLLTQPVPRRRIWLVKLLVVTLALLSVLVLFGFSLERRTLGSLYKPDFVDYPFICSMMILVCIAGGLWTTLLFRQIAAAIWFTPLVPGFLFVVVTSATNGFARDENLWPGITTLIAYSILSLIWAGWLFARAQDCQWTGGTVSFSFRWLWPARVKAGSQTKPRPRWLAWWIKEFHLHQPSLLLVGVAGAFHVAMILIRALVGHPTGAPKQEMLEYLSLSVLFLWLLVVPAMLGAMAVAEERKLGTLEGQLCLPSSRAAQFIIKFAVVLLLSLVFAGLLPWVLEELGSWLGVRNEVDMFQRGWRTLLVLATIVSFTASVSFYASTMARNTLQALGIAVVLGVAAARVLSIL